MTPASRPVLLAEDQPLDVFLMRRALALANISNPLFVARDGAETIDYVRGEGLFADRQQNPFPHLLLLDMEMPLLDGFEVLAWLRSRTEFDHLPIVMLSTSDLEADILKAKGMGADDYRVKPVGSRALIALLDDLHARWLGENPQPVLVRSCPINLPATILHLPTSKSSTPDGGNNPPRRPRRPRSTPRHPSAHRRPDDHRVAA